MQSRKLPDLPIATSTATAIMINDHVYVCGGLCGDVVSARTVQVYSVSHQTWNTLPLSPQYHSQGVEINGHLVLIGGREPSSHAVTNLVSTWNGRVWHQELPPMPTKRVRPGVTTYQNLVVVAGGRGEDEQTLLSSIAILNITTLQWSTADNFTLPRPMGSMQLIVSKALLYVTSAVIECDVSTDTAMSTKTAWQLPLSALENALTTEGDNMSHHWTEIAPTPCYNSVLLQDTAYIVAVGGRDELFAPTSDVFVYDPNNNKWTKVGQLGVPRTRCAVVSLSNTSFIVYGGCTDTRDIRNTLLTSVEMVHHFCQLTINY